MNTQVCNKRWPLAIGFIALIVSIFVTPALAAQFGKASWYAMTSRTASGEFANPAKMTAAHRTLKFGTKIRVTNLGNSRSVILCVNDRGPFVESRIVDVTKAAADRLGFMNAGMAKVRVDIVGHKSNKCG